MHIAVWIADADAAYCVPVAVKRPVESKRLISPVFDIPISSNGTEVVFDSGIVGEVCHQAEELARIVISAIHTRGEQFELPRGVDEVGVFLCVAGAAFVRPVGVVPRGGERNHGPLLGGKIADVRAVRVCCGAWPRPTCEGVADQGEGVAGQLSRNVVGHRNIGHFAGAAVRVKVDSVRYRRPGGVERLRFQVRGGERGLGGNGARGVREPAVERVARARWIDERDRVVFDGVARRVGVRYACDAVCRAVVGNGIDDGRPDGFVESVSVGALHDDVSRGGGDVRAGPALEVASQSHRVHENETRRVVVVGGGV